MSKCFLNRCPSLIRSWSDTSSLLLPNRFEVKNGTDQPKFDLPINTAYHLWTSAWSGAMVSAEVHASIPFLKIVIVNDIENLFFF